MKRVTIMLLLMGVLFSVAGTTTASKAGPPSDRVGCIFKPVHLYGSAYLEFSKSCSFYMPNLYSRNIPNVNMFTLVEGRAAVGYRACHVLFPNPEPQCIYLPYGRLVGVTVTLSIGSYQLNYCDAEDFYVATCGHYTAVPLSVLSGALLTCTLSSWSNVYGKPSRLTMLGGCYIFL